MTPEEQENEVVEVDTVTRTNENEVEILPEDNICCVLHDLCVVVASANHRSS